jgi:hypothetical protein
MTITEAPARRNRRPKKRELFCPTHPEQLIQGNGKKYYLHLLQPEQLQQRGKISHTVRWAPRDLWEQVAHVDPTAANPTVSEYTRRNARRNAIKRVDGKRFYD